MEVKIDRAMHVADQKSKTNQITTEPTRRSRM